MKFFVLFMILSCSSFVGQDFLYAIEDWYQPPIHSHVYSSFCEDPVPYSLGIPEFYGQRTTFAASSIPEFKLSVQRYFSKNDCDGIFFRYVPSFITGQDTICIEESRGVPFHYVPIYPKQDLLIRIIGGLDYYRNDDHYYLFPYKGLKLKAVLSENFSLDGYWWAGHFVGDKKYYLTSPLIDGYYQQGEGVTYLDNLQGAIKYNRSHFQMSVGRGKYQIGNNISGSIVLNNAVNDYGFISSKLEFGSLSLSYLHGALTPDQTEIVHFVNGGTNSVDSSRVDKYIVMHKLDWEPSQCFSGFIGEEIIYGNRSLDLNYLMPHVFWRIIEHNLEDRDNVLVFGGFNWKINRNFTVYQNTLFDEFAQKKILTNWWGSKYALQTGISYHKKRDIQGLDSDFSPRITMEMTAVRPWTYTHFIKWNKFSNDNISLGYPIGSNCLNYSMEADYPMSLRIFIGLNASYSRQGSTGNRFDLNTSDPELIPDIDHTKTRWLAGTISNTTRLKVMTEWKPLYHHFIRLGTTMSRINEDNWTQDLFISYRTEF